MARIVLGTACLILIFGLVGQAQTALELRTPEEVVKHHWEAFSHHDVEAVLSDYADDAIFIAGNRTVQGKAALRQMFTKAFSDAANGKAPSFEVKITADGDVGYEHWVSNAGKPDASEGTDAFVVRHGRILFHTVVGVHPAGTQSQK